VIQFEVCRRYVCVGVEVDVDDRKVEDGGTERRYTEKSEVLQ